MALEQDPRMALEVNQKEKDTFSDRDLKNLVKMTDCFGANIYRSGLLIALAIFFHGCVTFFS